MPPLRLLWLFIPFKAGIQIYISWEGSGVWNRKYCIQAFGKVTDYHFWWIFNLNFQANMNKKSLKCSKNGNLNMYISMTTGQTQSAEDDDMKWSKAPEQLPWISQGLSWFWLEESLHYQLGHGFKDHASLLITVHHTFLLLYTKVTGCLSHYKCCLSVRPTEVSLSTGLNIYQLQMLGCETDPQAKRDFPSRES